MDAVFDRVSIAEFAGAVVAYELDPDRRAELACAVVGRNLTRAEWDRYLDGLGDDYRATCPEYPAP